MSRLSSLLTLRSSSTVGESVSGIGHVGSKLAKLPKNIQQKSQQHDDQQNPHESNYLLQLLSSSPQQEQQQSEMALWNGSCSSICSSSNDSYCSDDGFLDSSESCNSVAESSITMSILKKPSEQHQHSSPSTNGAKKPLSMNRKKLRNLISFASSLNSPLGNKDKKTRSSLSSSSCSSTAAMSMSSSSFSSSSTLSSSSTPKRVRFQDERSNSEDPGEADESSLSSTDSDLPILTKEDIEQRWYSNEECKQMKIQNQLYINQLFPPMQLRTAMSMSLYAHSSACRRLMQARSGQPTHAMNGPTSTGLASSTDINTIEDVKNDNNNHTTSSNVVATAYERCCQDPLSGMAMSTLHEMAHFLEQHPKCIGLEHLLIRRQQQLNHPQNLRHSSRRRRTSNPLLDSTMMGSNTSSSSSITVSTQSSNWNSSNKKERREELLKLVYNFAFSGNDDDENDNSSTISGTYNKKESSHHHGKKTKKTMKKKKPADVRLREKCKTITRPARLFALALGQATAMAVVTDRTTSDP